MSAIPQYNLYALKGTKQYSLTGAVCKCSLSERDKQIAQTMDLQVADFTAGGTPLRDILEPGGRIFLEVRGEQSGTLFEGYIWTTSYDEGRELLSLTCYDPLIYLQNSSDALFFPDGRSSQSILQEICQRWEIPLNYSYESAAMEKQIFQNKKLSDIIIDVLEEVKKKTGVPYRIRYENQRMDVSQRGCNRNMAEFFAGRNLTGFQHAITLNGMVTQILITGKAEQGESAPIEATLRGESLPQYGTLQAVKSRSGDQSLADAKQEAQRELDEHKTPEHTYTFTAPDYPFLHKGDVLRVTAASCGGLFYVTSITHDLMSCTMSVEVEP